MNTPEPIKETEKNIEGEAYLEHVEPGQWPRGVFYPEAYVLRSHYAYANHPEKTLTSGQEDRGRALTERLRALLQARVYAAGWRPVANTKDGQAIWVLQRERQVVPAPDQRNIVAANTGEVSGDQGGEDVQSKPIYRRTRPVTFTCQWCREEVTEQRFPSHTPLYCSKPACKKEAIREKTRERVASWRKAHPDARRKKAV